MSPGAAASGKRPAVFLDRDGTLIEDAGFLHDPALVRLLPGSAAALASLHRAGFALVVVTNQSGIARGLYTGEAYEWVARRVEELLAQEGTYLDAQYHCPHHPDVTGPCECRKPGLGLYREAARAFGLDLPASWWVGDRLTDLLPAREGGGQGILVLTGSGPTNEALARAQGFVVTATLAEAAERILGAGPHSSPASGGGDEVSR